MINHALYLSGRTCVKLAEFRSVNLLRRHGIQSHNALQRAQDRLGEAREDHLVKVVRMFLGQKCPIFRAIGAADQDKMLK